MVDEEDKQDAAVIDDPDAESVRPAQTGADETTEAAVAEATESNAPENTVVEVCSDAIRDNG